MSDRSGPNLFVLAVCSIGIGIAALAALGVIGAFYLVVKG